MCGITGYVSSLSDMESVIEKMRDSMVHRGPDSCGSWVDEDYGIAFGHRRLAIQDLSSAGHQPMKSVSGRFVISFNGEIYNHFEIRKIIQIPLDYKLNWNGHSDTETLVTAFEMIGIEATLSLAKGMFALSVWDAKEKTLTLARDRMGEKPLYFGYVGNSLVFGSELKSILQFPEFNNQICKKALIKYFKFNYIPAPLSIYKNIYKLEPGKFIQYKVSSNIDHSTQSQSYWSYTKFLEELQNNKFKNSSELDYELENKLEKSIKSQLISDVPVGTFLSGGIDSSVITSVLQKNSMIPIKTFTIGFKDKKYDESPYALAISKHLRTDHNEMIVDENDVMNVIISLGKIYDEPFADSSQIPTTLISQMTKKHVTVALSGDAGDELFAGYNRYTHTPKVWQIISLMPFSARKILGRSINLVGVDTYDSIGSKLYPLKKIPHLGSKIHKMGERFQGINSLQEFCASLPTVWQDPSKLVKGMEGSSDDNFGIDFDNLHFFDSDIDKMMAIDSITYLPDDILCKVDRASMFASLETRVPFLDTDVMKVAAKTPLNMKIKNRTGKLPLRRLLEKYVPKDLFERPKSGFAIPIGVWLRGPLRGWAESLLDPSLIDKRGLLNNEPIQEMWKEHLSGKFDWTPKLWGVLMFQAWLNEIEST